MKSAFFALPFEHFLVSREGSPSCRRNRWAVPIIPCDGEPSASRLPKTSVPETAQVGLANSTGHSL